jgi:hypothetical protein
MDGDSRNDDDNPVKKLKQEIQSTVDIDLSVPERLNSIDKRILQARNSFAERKKYLNNGLISAGIDRLDMKVSPGNVARALRIMDVLIKNLELRGHSVVVSGDTYVMVKDEKMKILLRERLKIGEKTERWGSHNYIPTGKLYFKLDSYPQREWKDGKVPIEGQLADIVARLEVQGNEMLAMQIEWRNQRLAQEEKDRIRKELEERKKQDLSEFRNTLNKSKRWHKAANLRMYLDALESKAANEGRLDIDLINWLKWARKKADWYDPFVEEEDKLLEDVDREKLTFKEKSTYSWSP